MENNSKKSGKKGLMILVILGIILIAGGAALTYLSSPEYVSKAIIKEFGEKATALMNKKTETGLENDYKKESNVKLNLKSDYFAALTALDPSYATLSNLLNNLSNTENTITMIQDTKEKKLFLNLDSKLSGQSLINTKYLVENSTAYYTIDGITTTYVNNGNNNYFESLNSTNNTEENTKYLLEKTTDALANNLDKKYLSSSYTKEYKVISITLTKEDLVTYLNKVLKELRNDEKANTILTGYDPSFSDLEVTEKDLDGYETMKINVYLDKILSQVKVYELEVNKDWKLTSKQEEGKEIIEVSNKEEKTIFEVTTQGEKTEIIIKDNNQASLGSITITKTNTNYDIVANITMEQMTIDLGYNYQLTNLKKGTSYDSKVTMTVKVTAQDTTIFDGTMNITSTTTNETTITEDTSSSVLASSLSGTQNELLQQKLSLIILSLMS